MVFTDVLLDHDEETVAVTVISYYYAIGLKSYEYSKVNDLPPVTETAELPLERFVKVELYAVGQYVGVTVKIGASKFVAEAAIVYYWSEIVGAWTVGGSHGSVRLSVKLDVCI